MNTQYLNSPFNSFVGKMKMLQIPKTKQISPRTKNGNWNPPTCNRKCYFYLHCRTKFVPGYLALGT